ncbi:MAG: ribonucleoside triphosphate reductase, partial [Candidatus Bathyarchaeia archaeon]
MFKVLRYVRKRDGKLEPFDQERITNAIWKATKAVGEEDRELAKRLSDKVVDELRKRFGEDGVPTVEEIQDVVEKILIENGHAKIAKAYILYRKQHQDLRELAEILSSTDLVEQYLNLEDWYVRENSNMSFSLQGLNNYLTTKVIERYWTNRIYPPNIAEAHRSGDIHIHDLGVLGPYCVGWDLRDLLLSGFGGVYGKVESKPARHFRTALGQVVNFFYTLQGEAAGAQAFSNFDTLLAPFIRYDGLDYKEVKQALQEFVFNINVPTRVGFQTPFTNITLDLKVPEFMKGEPVIYGGKVADDAYGDMQDEMDMLNMAFAEVMTEGDARGRVFTFPIPTYNITKDFDWDSPVSQKIFELTAKYGVPYFSNFVNSDMKPEDVRSMCCRLRIDNRELRKRGGGFFGANPLTGSIGVVTINLPRIGYLTKDEDRFFERLGEIMDLAKDSLEIKRKVLERFTEKGLYPYSKHYLRFVKETYGKYWKNHFSTIGIIGMNEA